MAYQKLYTGDFSAVFVAISTTISVALALHPAAIISERFVRDIARISMKRDKMHMQTSYRQGCGVVFDIVISLKSPEIKISG